MSKRTKKAAKKKNQPERSVLKPGDSAAGAALKVFHYACEGIRANRAGAMEGASTDPLHDLRVAIRRFRAGLRLFKPVLQNTSLFSLDAPLAKLGDELSPYRDTDAWLEIIREPAFHRKFSDNPHWKAYYKKIQQDHLEQQSKIRLILGSANYRNLLDKLNEALLIELPAAVRARETVPVERYGAKVMLRAYKRIVRLEIAGMKAQDEEIHALRKRCRRARYGAEFLTPVLGPRTGELADYLKRIAGDLGTVHDMDVHLERLHAEHLVVPKKLYEQLTLQRKTSWKDFKQAWNEVRDQHFAKRLKKELKGAR